MHPSTGKSTLETVMCVLHAGGKFGGEESGYKVCFALEIIFLAIHTAILMNGLASIRFRAACTVLGSVLLTRFPRR